MGQVYAAAATDRLPWLNDEPKPLKPRGANRRELAGWAVAGLLAVAGGAYFLGLHSSPMPDESRPVTTITSRLPEVRDAGPAPQVALPAEPQVAPERQLEVVPVVRREVPVQRPPEPRANIVEQAQQSKLPAAPTPQVAPIVQQPPARAIAPLTLWPATQSQGAAGRVVRVGAFGSREQAKLGWRYMVRAYPAVAHLQATVVATRNSRGRQFYRFQIGTTSQAHSEVLCQRMGSIGLSCAVVGLPWKPNGVER